MRSRQDIKFNAKEAMKQQRGTAIVTIILVAIIIFAGSLLGRIPPVMFGSLLVVLSIFFVDMVLSVNSAGIFTRIFMGQHTEASEVLTHFQISYLRKVGGMAWMLLLLYLWSMLLIIPGIIKSYAYMMTPYILAEHPNVPAREALKLSMRMTHGHKMDIFVMHLSFIGWWILSAFTFGILGIVFVGPYMSTTSAGYYVELKQKALATGVVHPSELQ